MSYGTSTAYVPKQTNHLLHLVLSGITCGFWLPVWGLVALYNAMTKDKIKTVTQGPGAWYGPVARPYEVGPGAPVSAMNPHPPTPAVPPPVWRPQGVATWADPSEAKPMPPYVGWGPGEPTNMARPPHAGYKDDHRPIPPHTQ
jgi:hypothetical protein